MGITIKDVAKRAHVCPATVSRAYNTPELVTEEKRNAIFQAARELDYYPNALAQGLISKSTNSIGILVPDINNVFHPSVIQAIETTCAQYGYLSYICNTYGDIEKEKKSINALLKQRIDGFIFVGTRPTDPAQNEHIIELARRTEVLLMFDDLPECQELCAVYNDEVKGAYEAVNYLHSQGDNKIALFNSYLPYTTYQYKQRGYEKALRELGIPVREEYIFYEKPYAAGGYAAMEAMCARFRWEEMPKAVFTISDQMLAGVFRYCNEHRIRIPEDIRVCGFSGTQIVREFGLRFPTVDQKPFEIGELAAETLIRNIRHEGKRQRVIVVDSVLKQNG